ncbi:MAG: DUF4331 family protein [Candidatus Eremiobacteraeota bacterium]|nr:DUF4331 family protein [Candidatus Eremiobacteraeota bacterium]
MQRLLTIACVTAVSLASFSSCSNDPTVDNSGTTTNGANIAFQQIDRIGRPGLKELFLPYGNHDAFNRISPIGDPAQTGPQIQSYVANSAGRSAAIASYVEALLVPDVLVANLADPSNRASYLGWETGGKIADDCNGAAPTTFGGRSFTDDVVNAMLGLAYGNLATTTVLGASTPNVVTAVPPDDGREKNGLNGTPNLIKENVSCAGIGITNTFPYLGNP